jgi:hypothetical protein
MSDQASPAPHANQPGSSASTSTEHSGKPDAPITTRAFRIPDALVLIIAAVLGGFGAMDAWEAKVKPVLDPVPEVRSAPGETGSIAARGGPRNAGGEFRLPPPPAETPTEALLRKLSYASLLMLPPLAALTIGLALLRLVKPRGTLREVARHPGSLAILAASAVLLAIGVASGIMLLMPVFAYRNNLTESYSGFAESWGTVPLRLTATAAKPAALGVVIGWALLLLGRKGRRGRSWLEPAGVLTGLLWIVGAVGVALVNESAGAKQQGSISLKGVER